MSYYGKICSDSKRDLNTGGSRQYQSCVVISVVSTVLDDSRFVLGPLERLEEIPTAID